MALFNRQLEARIHEKLFDTIKLLTHIYPTTKDFNEAFKRNMFVKSNKTAFQHVIHYLFTILNPELTKEKLTWPLYDVKLETTFRNEVIAFINHINAEYEHANIPNMMASHLMSPGGYKFSKFMLKLSTFVMLEHLKRSEDVDLEVLNPVRPHKDAAVTNAVIKNLKTRTLLIEREVEEINSVFNTSCEKMTKDAEAVVTEQTEIGAELCTTNKLLKEKKEKMMDLQTVEALTVHFDELKDKMAALEQIKQLCEKCNELLMYLSNDKPVLEFKRDDFVVPEGVRHLFEVTDELNLHHLFNSLNVVMSNESLDMPIFTEQQLNDVRKLVTDLKEKYLQLDYKLSGHKNELVELAENFCPHVDDCSKVKKNPIIVLTAADDG